MRLKKSSTRNLATSERNLEAERDDVIGRGLERLGENGGKLSAWNTGAVGMDDLDHLDA